MGLLDDKTMLVTGVTHNTSIAYAAAQYATEQGARVIVSNFGRALSLTKRVVQKIDPVPDVIELDGTDTVHLEGLADQLRGLGVESLDGLVHSIAFAHPERALGGAFLTTGFDDVSTSVQVSTYSYVSLAMACRELMKPGSSIVGLPFDASVSWPSYDWMGIAKAGLESASRYLARYLGPSQIRSNLISAGPLDTIAKKAIPGSERMNDEWAARAPLGWDAKNMRPVGKAVVALLSDLFEATTGEIIHVDGGFHSTGF